MSLNLSDGQLELLRAPLARRVESATQMLRRALGGELSSLRDLDEQHSVLIETPGGEVCEIDHGR